MSFFGFDSSGRKPPRERRKQGEEESLDFEETYQGLGDYEEPEDMLNDETFGNAADLGTDFDFGYGKGELDAGTGSARSEAPAPVSYASIANAKMNRAQNSKPGFDQSVDMQPMESLWGNSSSNNPQQQQHSSSNSNSKCHSKYLNHSNCSSHSSHICKVYLLLVWKV